MAFVCKVLQKDAIIMDASGNYELYRRVLVANQGCSPSVFTNSKKAFLLSI